MLTGVHDDCRENVNAQLTTVIVIQSSHTPTIRLNSAAQTSGELPAKRITKSTENRLPLLPSTLSLYYYLSTTFTFSFHHSTTASRVRGPFINAAGDGVPALF